MRRTAYWKGANRTYNGILARVNVAVKAIACSHNPPFGRDERRLDFIGDRLAGPLRSVSRRSVKAGLDAGMLIPFRIPCLSASPSSS